MLVSGPQTKRYRFAKEHTRFWTIRKRIRRKGRAFRECKRSRLPNIQSLLDTGISNMQTIAGKNPTLQFHTMRNQKVWTSDMHCGTSHRPKPELIGNDESKSEEAKEPEVSMGTVSGEKGEEDSEKERKASEEIIEDFTHESHAGDVQLGSDPNVVQKYSKSFLRFDEAVVKWMPTWSLIFKINSIVHHKTRWVQDANHPHCRS